MTGSTQAELESKLITIASGKGGVGKTWVSVTLAQALSHLGRKVLLFDGDLGLANVDIQLGITPEYDISDVITGACNISSVIIPYEEAGAEGNGCLDVIAGQSGSGALGMLKREALVAVRTSLTELAAQYDHVLMDLAAGVDVSVTTLSTHRGRIYVVMTGDPTSLTDAYAFIKLAVMRNPNADVRIIVNNVHGKRDGEKAFEAIKKAAQGFLKFTPRLAGIIKTDKRVVDSIRSQMPILTRHPQADAASAVREIARQIPVENKVLAD
jgi:flagellar biosynthesis protein FlhG